MKKASVQNKTKRPDSARKAKRAGVVIVAEDAHWRRNAETIPLIRRAARAALNAAHAGGGTLTILLTGDAELKSLNTRFRGKRKATNVLSFPSQAADYIGDIAIGYGIVAREAKAQKKRIKAHAAHLAAHGVLHLLGYDHEDEADALLMEGLEKRILTRMGLPDPYAAENRVPRRRAA